jgi:hypothetical protein
MSWNKPKSAWQWLALLSPGAASLLFTGFGCVFLKPDDAITPAILGLPVTFILCAVVAWRLARGTGGAGKVLGLTLLFTFLLMIVNFSIAAGGCAVMPVRLDLK